MGDWVLRMTMGCQGLLIRALEAPITHEIDKAIDILIEIFVDFNQFLFIFFDFFKAFARHVKSKMGWCLGTGD